MRYPATMAAITDVAIFFCCLLDGIRLEKVNLMTVGSDARMAQLTVVLKSVPVLRPWTGQAHQFERVGAMAHQAGFRIDRLAQREILIRLIRRDGRFFTGVVSLMAGIAFHVHQLFGQRGDQMALMKSHLGSFIGVQGLVPGKCFTRFYARRRHVQNFAFDDLLVTARWWCC